MPYLLGQAPEAPCAVCGLSPVALEEVEGLVRWATCARCGLAYEVRSRDGIPYAQAELVITSGFLALFQRYYRETGRKLGIPPYLLELDDGLSPGPEHAERLRAMEVWMAEHQDLVAVATAPVTWPYSAVSLEAVEYRGEMRWHVHQPPGGLQGQVMVPFSPAGLPVGTLVTVLIPMTLGDPRTGTPAEVEVEIDG